MLPHKPAQTAMFATQHQGVFSLLYSADGKQLYSGGQDKLVRLWDPATGKEQRQFAEGRRPRLREPVTEPGEPRGQFRWIDPREAPAHRVERNHERHHEPQPGAGPGHAAMALFQLV